MTITAQFPSTDLGHGEYSEIPNAKELFSVVKASDHVVCHFCPENWNCKFIALLSYMLMYMYLFFFALKCVLLFVFLKCSCDEILLFMTMLLVDWSYVHYTFVSILLTKQFLFIDK